MFLNKINPASELFIARVGAGDVLESREPLGFEEPANGLSKGRQIAVPESFHHLNRNTFIITSLVIAEIFESDFNAVGQPCLLNTLEGEIALRLRNGERCNPAAARGGGM